MRALIYGTLMGALLLLAGQPTFAQDPVQPNDLNNSNTPTITHLVYHPGDAQVQPVRWRGGGGRGYYRGYGYGYYPYYGYGGYGGYYGSYYPYYGGYYGSYYPYYSGYGNYYSYPYYSSGYYYYY